MSVGPAPTLLPNPVAIWHGAIENISPHASPCRYMPPSRWAPMRESCLDFITRFGDQAHRLGWTPEQLFGVHPNYRMLRVEYCGALMISGNQVKGVELHWVAFERGRCSRDKLGRVRGVPVWEFKAKAS
jgi:hypothetical protein